MSGNDDGRWVAERAGEYVGQFEAARNRALQGETDPDEQPETTTDPQADNTRDESPPPTRDQAQREHKGLVQAIIDGDMDAVSEKMDFFGRIAERFGLTGMFEQLKSLVMGFVGDGPVEPDDPRVTEVNNGVGSLIDTAMPPPGADLGLTR